MIAALVVIAFWVLFALVAFLVRLAVDPVNSIREALLMLFFGALGGFGIPFLVPFSLGELEGTLITTGIVCAILWVLTIAASSAARSSGRKRQTAS